MDLQRYLLIGAIALLSFMLLTEWVRFQDEHATATTTAQHAARQQALNRETPEPDPSNDGEIPDRSSSAQGSSADIPEVQQQTPEPEPTAPSSQSGGDRIQVFTDVLEVTIDLQGGDIVYAALPQHAARLNTPEVPFVLLESNERRTYVSQSGLIGPDGVDTPAGRAEYRADAKRYELDSGAGELVVELTTETDKARVTKQFVFERGNYAVEVRYVVENRSAQPWQGALFGQIKRDSSPDPGLENKGIGIGMQSYLGAAMHTPEERYRKVDFDDIAEKRLAIDVTGGWIAMLQHYFVSAWVPNSEQTHRFSTVHTESDMNIIRFTSPMATIAPGTTDTLRAKFYAGPKDQDALEQLSPGLELTVDYGWLWWLAQPLFWLLTRIHNLLGNWGWSIVVVTILVKAAFFKLNATAFRSMANMRKVTPMMQEIRERYPDDRQKQSQAMMELYKKEKINPLGGCLPILVQMPVFLSLYWVLMESVELRHAPWILWINDLSVMDPYFILPLLMGLSMFIQQRLNPAPPDPMQAKIMQWMPVMFTVFFLWFPAGLVLYWVVNNTLSIAQQYHITRKLEAQSS